MKKNKVRILTLVVVFLLGVVAAVVSCLPSIKENLMLSAVLLSVGCSLLATAISTFVLLMSDNSLEETVQSSLRAVGIDVDLYKRHNQAKPISSRQDYSKLKKSTEKAIRKFQIKGPLSVGHFARTTLSNYYDLIGATCSSINAKHFASILSTFWQQSIASVDEVHHPAFDFVVTPKGGSPMLVCALGLTVPKYRQKGKQH